MIDASNILRLAGDGYDAQDIRKFTRVPIQVIQQVCRDAKVELKGSTQRVKPIVTVVKNSQPAKVKQNPLLVAQMWLGRRLVEKPSGYWLDDVPVNLTSIIRAANQLMKEAGAEQLNHNPTWLV